MLKKLALVAVGFIGGFIAYASIYAHDVENDGDVVYEDDKIRVRAGGNKTNNWSLARVD